LTRLKLLMNSLFQKTQI